MRIGVRGHDYGCASAAEMARRISDAGFCCMQLALHKAIDGYIPEYGHLSPGYCYNIRSAFENRNVEVSVIGCYIDPAVENKEKRLADVKRFREQVAYCRMLGSNIVGTETSNFSGDESGRELQYQRLLDSVLRMTEQAERFGVFVGIEPVAVHTLNTPELAYRLLHDVGSDNLQIILDPINLLTPNNISRQRDIIDNAFDAFGDRIVAVHAKDIAYDGHGSFKPCIIGEGIFDSGYFFDKLKIRKPEISVLREEANPQTASKDIAALRKFLAV